MHIKVQEQQHHRQTFQNYLNFRKYKYCRLDGSAPINVRDENIQGVFRILIQAFLYNFDRDYNPQLVQQAMDRTHRIGQKKKIMLYRSKS
ncbi:unnamed protein product (macronuclear) [Paramecium tetraurelia]|uniref:Helicase C-terminal domain-containing protein n=1 Tax=Paramecium tetraurelia TaxID=5888 RepID=A0BKL4_PARTE|nr:uncharacterized protein GSPATT00029712001 [Paramecium tetraurelia]CAK59081.1 unnamed protein product [Paramecium tetraurelia]|eukprot:XP_001426479.1 hypothetical protein (macronuclear) [Paramecium tetraurelia strain d4-2]